MNTATRVTRYIASVPLRRALLLGAAASLATVPPVFLIGGSIGVAIDTGQQVVLAAIAVLVLIRANRQSRGLMPERQFVSKWAAVSSALAAAAAFIWALPFERETWTVLGDAFVAASVGIIATCLSRAIFGSTPRSVWVRVALDTTILLSASITIIWVLWHNIAPTAYVSAGDLTNAVAGTLVLAGPIAAVLALLDRGVPVRLGGPFGILAGLVLTGVAMVGFELVSPSQAGSAFVPIVTPTDYGFSAGLLLCAYGAATWRPIKQGAVERGHDAQMIADTLPPIAAAICVGMLILWPNDAPGIEVLKIGTGVVAALTLGRQMLLTRNERNAMADQRESLARLERELRVREAVLRSLSRLEVAETAEETAAHVCREALAIDGIDTAILVGFMPGRQAVLLGPPT